MQQNSVMDEIICNKEEKNKKNKNRHTNRNKSYAWKKYYESPKFFLSMLFRLKSNVHFWHEKWQQLNLKSNLQYL